MEDNNIKLVEFTSDEIEVLSNYLLRKMSRLEEANLKDSKCYPILCSIYYKLQN